MKQFLQAKTLNLFLTLFLPKIVSLIIKPKIFAVVLCLDILQYILVLGYFYFLASALKSRLDPGVKISSGLFNACLVIAFILPCLRNFISYVPVQYQDDPVIFIPLALIITFIFYIYIHLGKLLTSVEQEQNIPFKKHLWESFLFLFFGLGIWALQPRIRKIFSEPVIPANE
jgi:hypothetical protein